MKQKYSDYTSLTQVSNTIHNLWLYKLNRFNLHQRLTHNIQVKLNGLKQIPHNRSVPHHLLLSAQLAS